MAMLVTLTIHIVLDWDPGECILCFFSGLTPMIYLELPVKEECESPRPHKTLVLLFDRRNM